MSSPKRGTFTVHVLYEDGTSKPWLTLQGTRRDALFQARIAAEVEPGYRMSWVSTP